MSDDNSMLPARRAVQCGNRWVDFDAALPLMDSELLTRAEELADEEISHERRWSAWMLDEIEAQGGAGAEYAAEARKLPDLDNDRPHENIFRAYCSLHKEKFGRPFDPDLPEVAPPGLTPVQEAHIACWNSFRDRMPGINRNLFAEEEGDDGVADMS